MPEPLAILLVLLALLAVPAWLLTLTIVTVRRIRLLERQVALLEERLLRTWTDKGPDHHPAPPRPAPPTAPTPAPDAAPPPAAEPATPPVAARRAVEEAPPPIPRPPSAVAAAATPATAGEAAVAESSAAAGPTPPAAGPGEVGRMTGWEQFMGVKLAAWVGGLALFLCVALFVKYSFEHNLISPEVRVAAGFLCGAALVAAGLLVPRARYAVTSQTLCATGIVVLYAVTYACRAVYGFVWFGQPLTLVTMGGITVAAFFLAVQMEARVVAVLGIVGGFLTPVLFPAGTPSAVGLFGYAALLDSGLIAVAMVRRWLWLPLLGAAGTVGLGLLWVSAAFLPATPWPTLIPGGLLTTLFLGAALATGHRQLPLRAPVAAAAGTAFAFIALTAWLLTFPELGRRPPAIFAPLLWADLCLCGLVFADPRLGVFHRLGGLVALLVSGLWTARYGTADLMPWALAATVGFAFLHGAAPFLIARWRPGTLTATRWEGVFPLLALALALIPILGGAGGSWLPWPAVLCLEVIALGVAVAAAALWVAVAALLLALVAALAWVARVPPTMGEGGLLVALGFAAFFVGASYVLRSRRGGGGDGTLAPADPAGSALIPAGGALLPFVLLVLMVSKTPWPNPSGLFGVALLLAVCALGTVRFFAADWVAMVAVVGTTLLEWTWHARHFQPASPAIALGWYLLFYAVYTAFPLLFRRELAGRVVPFAAGALAAPLHFLVIMAAIRRAWPDFAFPGAVALLFGVPAALAARSAWRHATAAHPTAADGPAAGAGTAGLPAATPVAGAWRVTAAWFAGTALFFLTVAIPIQFDREWITLGWALEGAALIWLWHRLPQPGLRGLGATLLAAAFVRLALNLQVAAYHPRGDWPILNWYLYIYGTAIACLFFGGRRVRGTTDGRRLQGLLLVLGWCLAFCLLNIEIADFFDAPGSRLRIVLGGNFARDMAYTVGWALFALTLLTAGIAARSRAGRYAGLALLGVCVLKAFLHDLAALGPLYRIGALLGVAVAAITASFLYQRFLPPRPAGATVPGRPRREPGAGR